MTLGYAVRLPVSAVVSCDRDINLSPLADAAVMAPSANRRRVFISHAYDDMDRANVITAALDAAGIVTTLPAPVQATTTDAVKQRLSDAIRASDVVIVLISAAAARSKWTSWELDVATSAELEQRGVDVIPALLDDTELPGQLGHRNVVDLSGDFGRGVRALVEQVQAATRIDFGRLSPNDFVSLVADLLDTLGFAVTSSADEGDLGADLKASRQLLDPFGLLETETWLVECKLYGRERISVEAIRQMARLLETTPATTRGLFVSNAQATSVAREYLADLERIARIRVRLLDRTELTALLHELPEVAARHFASPTGQPDALT